MAFRFKAALVASVFGLFAGSVQAEEHAPINVVATFSILGDMVQRVGGEHIELTTLVGPDGDSHVYQPTPADARVLNQADVLFVNGLEFEGWIDRLVEASGFEGTTVVATTGIKVIDFDGHHDDHHDDHAHKDDHHDEHDHKDDHHDEHDHKDDHHDEHDHSDHDHEGHDHGGHEGHDHGEFDPHAWQNVSNAIIYVDNITSALAKEKPSAAGTFFSNRATYVAELEALDAEIKEMIAAIPADKRIVVTSHDAMQYIARDYGFTFLAPQGISTESEASAQSVAGLIEQIREDKISAVFVENITSPRLIQQIATETGAAIGGTLYPGALSDSNGPASTYIDMIRHNATTIVEALK